MISLIKKDLILLRFWEYLVFLSAFIIVHLFRIQPDLIFVITLIAFTIMFFFYDHYYKMNRYVYSLPIKTSTIMMSRYISFYSIVIVVLAVQYIIINIITLFRTGDYLYSLYDLFILLCLATILISIVIPVYQLLKSFYTGSIILITLFMIATMSFGSLSALTTIEETSDPDIIWTVVIGNISLLDTIKLYITNDLFGIIGLLTLSLLIIPYLFSVFMSKRKNIA